MNFKTFLVRYTAVLLAIWIWAPSLAAETELPNPATRPTARFESSGWSERHDQKLELLMQGSIDLLMIGDSITERWEAGGTAIWDRYYKQRNAINLGFGNDRTEHVLWRIQNSDFTHIDPKLAILMIGTNNTNADHSPQQTAAGIAQILNELRARLPNTKILVLAIFPRGQTPLNYKNVINLKINSLVKRFADDSTVFFLDIGDAFLDSNGYVQRDVMPDLLHLSPEGYQLWAAAMESTISDLLEE